MSCSHLAISAKSYNWVHTDWLTHPSTLLTITLKSTHLANPTNLVAGPSMAALQWIRFLALYEYFCKDIIYDYNVTYNDIIIILLLLSV